MADQADFLAMFFLGPQRLAQPSLIARDHAGRGSKDMRGRAVILFQPHHLGTGKIRLEPQDVAHFRPAPAIDGLIVIPHAADVAMPPRQEPQPHVLGDVGILILVHKNIAKSGAVLFQHILMRLEDMDHMQQQIAEIDGVQLAQPGLIGRIKLQPAVVIGPRFARGQRPRISGRLNVGVGQGRDAWFGARPRGGGLGGG